MTNAELISLVENPNPMAVPTDMQTATVTPVPVPYVGQVSTKKRHHNDLILEGVVSHCAHCALALTDADSVESGLGSVCRKRGGFNVEPDQPDEFMAMAALSDYPELVDHLVQNWKPKGIRGLMNGMVRIASLNRRTEVHNTITNAIELLGYRALASVLRKSLAIASIKDSKTHEGHYLVWVKKADYKWTWKRDLTNLDGVFFSRAEKGLIVPVRHKRALWESFLAHYEGMCLTRPDGETVRIKRGPVVQREPGDEVPATA